MQGDIMYCKSCGKTFYDIENIYDSRTDKLLITNCVHCFSMHTINVNGYIKKHESRDGDQPNQYKNRDLYIYFKTLSISTSRKV